MQASSTCWARAQGRVAQGNCTPATGSPGAVARPRFPQNVACGFPAPRSSTGGSQHFAAIRSRFVSTVSFILSLHRGLSLPLHGARVAPERVICRQPLPPVNGSPVLRVLSTGLGDVPADVANGRALLVNDY